MKRYLAIWLLLIATALASCGHPSAKTQCIATPRLSAIDSVMWQQPDSAFTLLLAFAESPEADSLDEFNGHYFQLLVSELLYKNDYEQTNRKDLLKAVAYFDTVDNAFLDARAHYINGVGFFMSTTAWFVPARNTCNPLKPWRSISRRRSWWATRLSSWHWHTLVYVSFFPISIFNYNPFVSENKR